jgi:PST family polysaccharide transporter
VINWALSCLDSVTLGRTFGTVQLGLYNRVFSLVGMPTYHAVSTMQAVLFSACSRAQHDSLRLRQAYLGALGIVAFVFLPICSVVAVIPETVIAGVYGNKWLAAVTVLTPIALAMAFRALMGLGGPVIAGMGKAEYEIGIQLCSLALFAPLLWWASGYTIELVAWVVCATYVLRFVLVTHFTVKLLRSSWLVVGMALYGPAALAAACATLTFVADKALHAAGASPELELAFVGCFASGVTVLGFVVAQRWLVSKPVAQLLSRVAPSLPAGVRWLISG